MHDNFSPLENFLRFDDMRIWLNRLIFGVILFVFALGLAEVGGRFYMKSKFKTGFSDRSDLLYHYYHKILHIQNDRRSLPQEQFKVLLLGGSVLHPNNGTVAEHLKDQLLRHFDQGDLWIYNAAIPGHSSRDSYLKTIMLEKDTFDLVIFYHGINETRANNCSQDVFQINYDHMGWYAEVHNAFHHDSLDDWSCLPFLLDHVKTLVMNPSEIPQNKVPEDLMKYGKEVKTGTSFYQNLNLVFDYARLTGASFLVPTFSYHLDPNYSRGRFEAGELSYSPEAIEAFPVELWGRPENVAAAIDVHNQVITDFVEAHGLPKIEANKLLEKSSVHFDDICHFSDSGSARFVQIIIPEILNVASHHPRFVKESQSIED